MLPPHIFTTAKKGFHKLMDVGAMVEMPGGGVLIAMVKTVQERPAETRRVIRALQVAKDEVRKSKPKTVELIMRLLKMDKTAPRTLTMLSRRRSIQPAFPIEPASTTWSARSKPKAVSPTAK